MANSKLHIICKRTVFLLCLCLLYACRPADVAQPTLVVEGWIDADQHPVVLLHTTYPLNNDKDTFRTLAEAIPEHIITFGRVVLYDGSDSVILTGRVDTNYMPPYIYTTVFMKGEVGKEYRLHASYKNYSATATTFIPSVPVFDSIFVRVKDSLNTEICGYCSHLIPGEHYLVMVKKAADSQYSLCPMGVFEAQKEQMRIDIRNPLNFGSKNRLGAGYWSSLYFPKWKNTKIGIKFAHIGADEYRCWDSFGAQSLTQGVFFVETHKNIATNISGGLGCWCGMGAAEYEVSIDHTEIYRYTK